MINDITFQPLTVFGVAAGFYFLLCWPLSLLSIRLEQRLRGGVTAARVPV
jgi:polar amino acid transport system permease protein